MKWRRLIASPTLRHDILAIWVDGLEGVARDVMSALGQKQTYAVQNGISALHPKADMCSATRYVRFVPIADIPPFKRRQLVYTGSMTY